MKVHQKRITINSFRIVSLGLISQKTESGESTLFYKDR